MASVCRSALMAGSRSVLANSRKMTCGALTPVSISSSFSSSTRAIPFSSRIVSVLGTMDSLMPLHTAIASARLKSRIAVDSSCWSWLSQDFAVPR